MARGKLGKSKPLKHVVVLGNGVAGNSASSAIRDLDSNIAVTIVSDEAVPHYSACVLGNYLAGEIPRKRVFLKTPQDYRHHHIHTLFGQKAMAIDVKNRRLLLEDQSLDYDRLVIATGSMAVVPPIEGVDKRGVFTLKSIADSDRILRHRGKKAAVVGSGPIGIEASVALRKRGYEVVLIELLDRILPAAFDEKPSGLLRKAMEGQGIQVLTGEKVARLVGGDRVKGVVTDKREIECDLVIMAVGMKPNVEVARQAGIAMGRLGGIKTDKYLATNIEDIYACGDCVESTDIVTGQEALNLLWINARQQGFVAGSSCLGIKAEYPGSLNVRGIDIFGTHAVSIGPTEASFAKGNIRIVEKTYGKNYCRFLVRDGALVGVQAVGEDADMGILLSLARKGVSLDKVWEAVNSRGLLPLSPWYIKISKYMSALTGLGSG